ncbi:MAG TPA: glycoside hydrolase [Balneolaceae bacterium]|nr:glycoside hydrolase [Balneolaceae bacterium]
MDSPEHDNLILADRMSIILPKNMSKFSAFLVALLFFSSGNAQSPSFSSYVNPVIPGDHPDPTLTKIVNYFYTSGSSFNPTPKIYRSSDLVHWEVISQPVKPEWSVYGNDPGGGIWGGHMVFYNDIYWHYFGRGGGNMYFVTADDPRGPWSDPVLVTPPSGISYLGVDNSIFIDEDTGKWYMLTKHGRSENEIIELGDDGQPNGNIIDLGWLNPDEEGNPLGWAEGPVMWKYNGTYYYSVAQHLAGAQYVMKSDTLTDNPASWSVKPEPMQFGSRKNYQTPNHISPVVLLDDSTSWAIGHSYHKDWITQGRQGLLLQITYDEDGFPQFEYPQNAATSAPALHSGGIPWAVPHSDMFNSEQLHPEWSFLGNGIGRSHSLTDRPGWLHLIAGDRGNHTLIKNDGEHQYSIITRMEFDPQNTADQAGLYIMNGPENLKVRVFNTMDQYGKSQFMFTFDRREYDEQNTIGTTFWLKLERNEHEVSGFYSDDGASWTQIGRTIDASELNVEQTDFNSFTGNQQGIFTQSKDAYFDLYIYRDAYSPMYAHYAANYSGAVPSSSYLDVPGNGDWAMLAGVEFGTEILPASGFDYQRTPESVSIEAASSVGGSIELWADSLETGTLLGEVTISNTGGSSTYETFSADIDSLNGQHDLYLLFKGSAETDLMRIKEIIFTPRRVPSATGIQEHDHTIPERVRLYQNYPNPFNPTSVISYQLPASGLVTLKVFDALGREVAVLVDQHQAAGSYEIPFNAYGLASGIYMYRLEVDSYSITKKMMLLK